MPPELNVPASLQTPAEGTPPSGAEKEMTPDVVSEFVQLAEEGGWVEEPTPSGDVFPDLPPVAEPAAVSPSVLPAPTSTPPTPAGSTPAVAPSVPTAQPVVPPVPGVEPAPPAPGVTPPAPVAPAVAPQAAPVVGQPEPAPVAAPAATPAPAVLDPFGEIAKEVAKQEEGFIKALAEHSYKISEDDHNAYLTGDSSKLSLLCARIHTNAVGSVMKTVSAYLPVVVGALLKQARDEEGREQRFWDANPHLKKSEHASLLPKVLQTYNALNPGVDEDRRIREVGILLAQLHSIPLGAPAPAAAPTPPPVRTPGPVVRAVPTPSFVPAGASGAPAAPQPNGPTNPWDTFVEFAVASEQGKFDT